MHTKFLSENFRQRDHLRVLAQMVNIVKTRVTEVGCEDVNWKELYKDASY